jgi:excisionase family DNA binding protein
VPLHEVTVFAIADKELAQRRKFNSPASQFLDYELLLMRARAREIVPNRPKRGRTMSILKKLRECSEPLNVKEVAELLCVSEATIQRWVRGREVPALRIGDTIRFDPGLLADWIEQRSIASGEADAASRQRRDSHPAATLDSEDQ